MSIQLDRINASIDLIRTQADAALTLIRTSAVELDQENFNNSSQVGLLSVRLSALQSDLQSAADKVTQLEAQLAAGQIDQATATARVTQLEAQLGASATKVAQLETDLTAARARISDIEPQLATARARIAPLEADLLAARARTTQLEADLAAARTRISELEGQLPSLPTVSLSLPTTAVNEDGAPNLVFTFTRSGSLTQTLIVNFTISGTATAGTDYNNVAGSVTFAASSATATLTVNPTADNTVEPNETVVVTINPSPSYIVGSTAVQTGTIVNDDITPPITPPPGNDYIPVTFNDPIFASVTERTSPLVLTDATKVTSNVSIQFIGGLAGVESYQPNTRLDRIRFRCREGYRGGNGEQYLTNIYGEAIGAGTDHADTLQMYGPGQRGRVTLKNSCLRVSGTSGTPNAAYFSADNWMGAHVLENVLLSGGGVTLFLPGDGGTSVSLRNVYIEATGSDYLSAFRFVAVPNRIALIRWENVRSATTVNGNLVLGAPIPQPYGIVRDYSNAIYGTSFVDQAFNLGASGGGTYVGDSGVKTYSLTSLGHSLLANPHWITDFKIGIDVFNGPNTTAITPVVVTAKPTALTASAIGSVLTGANYPVNGAAIFRFGGADGERLFLAINDGTAGFSASSDAIVEITGYSGNLSQLRLT